jgi:hypothetical protein
VQRDNGLISITIVHENVHKTTSNTHYILHEIHHYILQKQSTMSDNIETHLEKTVKYSKYIESASEHVTIGLTTLSNLHQLMKDDNDDELKRAVAEAEAKRPAEPDTDVPESEAKKAKADTLDLTDPHGDTWMQLFDPNDYHKLGFVDQVKADSCRRKMQQTYRSEMNLVKTCSPSNKLNLYTYDIGPLRGIVGVNMSHGRNSNPVKYIAMIGFLANYKEEIGEIVHLTNNEFQIVVESHHITTLKEWRKEMLDHYQNAEN